MDNLACMQMRQTSKNFPEKRSKHIINYYAIWPLTSQWMTLHACKCGLEEFL